MINNLDLDGKILSFDKSLQLEIPNHLDSQIVNYLIMFTVEYTNIKDYIQKLDRLFSFKIPIFPNIPRLLNYKICLGIYFSSIGVGLSLIKIAKNLALVKNSNGYSKYIVSYHNWNSRKQVKIVSPIDQNSSHKFSISCKGTVRQNSPTSYEQARKENQILLDNIRMYVINDESPSSGSIESPLSSCESFSSSIDEEDFLM